MLFFICCFIYWLYYIIHHPEPLFERNVLFGNMIDRQTDKEHTPFGKILTITNFILCFSPQDTQPTPLIPYQ